MNVVLRPGGGLRDGGFLLVLRPGRGVYPRILLWDCWGGLRFEEGMLWASVTSFSW